MDNNLHHGRQHSPHCLRGINQMARGPGIVTTWAPLLSCVFMLVSTEESSMRPPLPPPPQRHKELQLSSIPLMSHFIMFYNNRVCILCYLFTCQSGTWWSKPWRWAVEWERHTFLVREKRARSYFQSCKLLGKPLSIPEPMPRGTYF